MKVHYLEIVTPDVDRVCGSYRLSLGIEFGDPDPALGNARTALLPDDSWIGVRAPMHESEQPVIRPYWLVQDIEQAVHAVEENGGIIAHLPMEIPGKGKFAIFIQGNTQHGLWEL
jgi:predicted enzyme related to lactoylglutathione lyase